jgi:hypothetical protein
MSDTRLKYDQCLARMRRYRELQRWSVLAVICIPGLLFLGVSPVRVVSLWLLSLVLFGAAHIYRVYYREKSAEQTSDHGEQG